MKYFLTTLYGNHKLSNIDKDYLFVITKSRAEAKAVKAVNNTFGRIQEYDGQGLQKELALIYKECAGMNYRVIDTVTPSIVEEE